MRSSGCKIETSLQRLLRRPQEAREGYASFDNWHTNLGN
jgi:hypothetical protein